MDMPATIRYFFEIAVYRCAPDAHHDEMEKKKQKYLSGITRGEAPQVFAFYERWFEQKYWSPWQYNQAIGWLRLYGLGTQVRAEYFFVKAKRITRRMKYKRFFWQGKAFELHFDPSSSSSEIYVEISKALERLRKQRPFKKRYIDLAAFYQLGPFVNWRALIGFE